MQVFQGFRSRAVQTTPNNLHVDERYARLPDLVDISHFRKRFVALENARRIGATSIRRPILRTNQMVTDIRVPTIENAGITLYIGRWFKRVGDPVSADEPLVEIDTDNVTHEIRSPVTGVLSSIAVRDGGSVDAGTVVGSISQFSSGGPTEGAER